MGGFENCHQKPDFFIPKYQYTLLLEGEGRCNKLRQNSVQHVHVVSDDQIIQQSTTIVGQVQSECIVNYHHYPLKFQRVYTSMLDIILSLST
jgi:hypothetical protein